MGKVAEADLSAAGPSAATAKLVLMRMAFAINTLRGDFVVWPSIGHVSRDCHLSRSAVKRAQRALERLGLIALVQGARQWHTARWRIEVAAVDALRFGKYRVSGRRPNDGSADPVPAEYRQALRLEREGLR